MSAKTIVHNPLLKSVLLAGLVGSLAAFAADKKAKSACEEGWTEMSKGWCYQLGKTQVSFGATYVDFVVKAPKSYEGAKITVSMHKDGKLVCTGFAAISNIQAHEETAAKGQCSAAVESPDKITLRVDHAFEAD